MLRLISVSAVGLFLRTASAAFAFTQPRVSSFNRLAHRGSFITLARPAALTTGTTGTRARICRAASSSLSSATNGEEEDLNALRVPELKDRLRDLGLKVGGRKAELIERLQSHYLSTSTGEVAFTTSTTTTTTSMPPSKRKSGASDADEADAASTAAATSPAKKKAATKDAKPKPKKKKTAADHQRQTERTPIAKLWDGAAATAKDGSYTLKICSWNVAGLRAILKNTPEALPDLVKKHGIDVLCLQETKLQEMHVDDPKLKIGGHLLVEEGYEAHYSCSTTKKGYSGTAVFVKKRDADDGKGSKKQASLSSFFGGATKNGKSTNAKDHGGDERDRDMNNIGKVDAKNLIPEVSFGIGKSKHDGEGRSITLDFPGFVMTNLYVPNSGQKLDRLDYRTEEWDKDLLEYMQSKEIERKCPVIWLGDLNVAHKAADTWNEGAKHLVKSAGTTPQERASFEKQLEAGYVDAFRELHGEEALGHYSYWSQRAGNREPNKGLRLDYFICSKGMLKDSKDNKVVVRDSYMIPDQKGSDHCPIVLELEIKC